MFRKLVTALSLLLPATGAFAQSVAPNWETGTQQRHRDFYQNVMEDDLSELVSGHVWVLHGTDALVGTLIFLGDGTYFQCLPDPVGNPRVDGFGRLSWSSVRIDKVSSKVSYPLLKTVGDDGEGYLALKYLPSTGALYGYSYWKRHWWEHRAGHLQEDIPALAYTLCPALPAPEMLGLKVNRKQTSPFYSELVAQDPGRRVKRPDLVTEQTWVKY